VEVGHRQARGSAPAGRCGKGAWWCACRRQPTLTAARLPRRRRLISTSDVLPRRTAAIPPDTRYAACSATMRHAAATLMRQRRVKGGRNHVHYYATITPHCYRFNITPTPIRHVIDCHYHHYHRVDDDN